MRPILKTETIGVRLTPEVREWLKERAKRRGLSISELLRWLILSYMEQQGYNFEEVPEENASHS